MSPFRKKQTMRQAKLAKKRWRFSASSRAFVLVGVVVLSFIYLFQINTVSSKGFEVSELERQITDLERETKQLEVDIATHSSMQSIQERLGSLDMVAVDSVEYVTPVGSSVARR